MEVNKLTNNQEINLENNKLIKPKTQNNFLETILGKTINNAIDVGIRFLFPDFIEDQVINVKDNLLNYGLKEGINRTIEDAINLGKSAIGIVTGNFENIAQMQNAVQTGGIIDGLSSLIDTTVNKVTKAGKLDYKIGNIIKNSKNIILNNIENNIEKTFNNQFKSFEYAEKYMENWKQSYEKRDFKKMEQEYNRLEKELKNLVPLEKILKKAREIENIHNLIKNNGQRFELTKDEIELSRKLS